MVFFDEKGSIKLGTLAVSMPQLSGQSYLSSVLLGGKNVIITKLLADHFSKSFNSLALVSTHLAKISGSDASILIDLAKKLTKRILSKG